MRLIDADALKGRAYRMEALDTQRVINEADIDSAPVIDAVPVIRCSDCIHSRRGTIYPMLSYCYNQKFNGNGFCTTPDGYCSYGERAGSSAGVSKRKQTRECKQ